MVSKKLTGKKFHCEKRKDGVRKVDNTGRRTLAPSVVHTGEKRTSKTKTKDRKRNII